MSVVDKLLGPSENSYNLGDTGYNFIDADTLQDSEGKKYRIQGIDAPEIQKIIGGKLKSGTAGGEVAFDTIKNLANNQGFTNIIKTGEIDPFGREIIDLQNPDTGVSFKNQILSSGVLDPTRYTTNIDNLSAQLGKHERDLARLNGEEFSTDWDKARESLKSAKLAEGFKQYGFRKTALDEAELATAKRFGVGNLYARDTVGIRDYGRDLDNKSNNPLSTSWDIGLNGVAEGLYGAVDLIGETTGWNWAEQIGENGVKRAHRRLADKPKVVASLDQIDGIWGKDGFVQYVVNNAAISLPYMAITGGAALAAPFTAGLSLAAPASVYSGQVWNEMEGDNKNAGLAVTAGIAQAVLDRVGLKFLGKATLLSKEGRNKAIQALANKRNISTDEAKQVILGATRREVADLATDAAKFAKQQLTARNTARALIQRFTVAGGGEAVTEMAQEAIGYTAAHTANGFETWDANDFIERMQNAGVAGFSLGGGFSVPGTIYDAGAWADVAYRTAPATRNARSWAGLKAEEDIQQNGKQYNIQERNEELNTEAAAAKDHVEDINQRVNRNKRRKDNRTTTQLGRDLWNAIPGLWRGLTRQAFDLDLQSKSKTARLMGESFGSNLQRSTSGAAYENRKWHILSELKNSIPTIKQTLFAFNLPDTGSSKKEFSNRIYTAYQQAAQRAAAGNREIDWDSDVNADMRPFLSQLKVLHGNLNNIGNKMHTMQSKYNPKLGYVKDYLLKYKSFNKAEIERNQADFEQALIDEFKVNPDQARQMTNAILNIDGVSDIDDAFSLTQEGDFVPPSHKKRSLGLSEKAKFAPFMENNLFQNISNAAKSATRYTALQEFVGANNSKVNYQLDKIQQELVESGLSEAEAQTRVDKLAADMKDYFDAESGNYKRVDNPLFKNIQKNILFFTTISGLPLAVLSNMVELMMVYRGLTKDQIFGKSGLQETGKTFAREVMNTLKDVGVEGIARQKSKGDFSGGHGVLQDLGFFEWEVGAAHTTGVTETGQVRKNVLDWFFKTILLQQWTNATRASRAAIAGDYITDKLGIIDQGRNQEHKTNETVEAEEAIRNLGLDPKFMIDYMNGNIEATPENNQKFDNFMRDGAFNFINEAIALPQSANRPKIFQDPRFALFTQFQGFISTFTANHIPRIWGEYVKRGTPAMKYNAFALMSTMIMMGFVSQHLKDLLKYGKSSPYFEGTDYIRRGIGASGLLGTGERVIDFVFPIYEERYHNPISWAFGTVSGESAGITKTTQVVDAIANIVEGNTEKGLIGGARALPLAGPFNKRLPQWGNFIQEWTFGE